MTPHISRVFTPCPFLWALASVYFSTSPATYADAWTASDVAAVLQYQSDMHLIVSDFSTYLSDIQTACELTYAAVGSVETSVDRVHTDLTTSNTRLSNIYSILSTINSHENNIEDYVRYIRNNLPPDYSTTLSSLSSTLSSFKSDNHTDLAGLASSIGNGQSVAHQDALRQQNLLSNLVVLASTPSTVSPDVLAGNPWWHTNSAFVLTAGKYGSAYPSDVPDTTGVFSFPQFMSKWSGFLSMPATTRALVPSQMHNNWHSWFGLSAPRFSNANATTENIYTWFDWMSDAMRSNWTIRATQRAYVDSVDQAGEYGAQQLATDIAYQNQQDAVLEDDVIENHLYAEEPEPPDYTVASSADTSDADKDNLLDALQNDNIQHSSRLVLINGSDFRDATGVDGEMVVSLNEGRLGGFFADLSTITTAGWYALLAIASAILFWRKETEISAIVRGTNLSRVD